MTDTNGVQVIAGMRPRVGRGVEELCTPMTSRAAHVEMGLLKKARGGCIGGKNLANFLSGNGEEFGHGR